MASLIIINQVIVLILTLQWQVMSGLSFRGYSDYDSFFSATESHPEERIQCFSYQAQDYSRLGYEYSRLLMRNRRYRTTCQYATQENIQNQRVDQKTAQLVFYNSEILKLPTKAFNTDNHTNIEELNLSLCSIEVIEENVFPPNLQTLRLDSNTIGTIAPGMFAALPKLKQVELQNNVIVGVLDQRNLTGIGVALEILRLGNNQIQGVNKSTFASFPNLQELDLKNNNIRRIEYNLFEMNPKLRKITFRMNLIKEIGDNVFGSIESILFLDLGLNKLTEITAAMFKSGKILKTTSIASLDLSYNDISKFDSELLASNIQYGTVLLNGNKLTNFSSARFAHSLNIADNNIVDLKDISLSNTAHALDASNNSISDVTGISDIEELTDLFLENNKIEVLKPGVFSKASKLVNLRLDGNKIKELELGIFTGLSNLKMLNVSFNEISEINPGIFFSLRQLELLYLGGNRLTVLPAGKMLRSLKSLKVIGLSHNPWSCVELLDILHVLDTMSLTYDNHGSVNYTHPNVGHIPCIKENFNLTPSDDIYEETTLKNEDKYTISTLKVSTAKLPTTTMPERKPTTTELTTLTDKLKMHVAPETTSDKKDDSNLSLHDQLLDDSQLRDKLKQTMVEVKVIITILVIFVCIICVAFLFKMYQRFFRSQIFTINRGNNFSNSMGTLTSELDL